jgi:hypothetical protein
LAAAYASAPHKLITRVGPANKKLGICSSGSSGSSSGGGRHCCQLLAACDVLLQPRLLPRKLAHAARHFSLQGGLLRHHSTPRGPAAAAAAHLLLLLLLLVVVVVASPWLVAVQPHRLGVCSCCHMVCSHTCSCS